MVTECPVCGKKTRTGSKGLIGFVLIPCPSCREEKIHMKPEKPKDGIEIELMAEAVHKAYCNWYYLKHKKHYWTYGRYNLLDEETKEADRYTVRAVLARLKECGVEEIEKIIGKHVFDTSKAEALAKEFLVIKRVDETPKK